MKQLSATICLTLAAASCSPSTAIGPADVTGSWARPGDAFPPVNLTLTDSASVLRARLQLSGTDVRGTATLEGNRLRLVLDGRPEIRGEFVSATELRLESGGAARSYVLYRKPSPR